MNLDFSFFTLNIISNFIIKGLLFSIKLTLVTLVCGLIIGTMIAMMRLSKFKILNYPALGYVVLIRSLPFVMVILWVFILIPLVIGKSIGSENSAYITYIVFESAFYSEIMRSGIQSVKKEQMQAGYAVGLTYFQSMRYIILPQAFRNMLPVILTQTIVLFQDTSLVYAIGAYDLLKGFDIVGKNFGRPIEAYLLAAVTYFLICFSLSKAVRAIQAKVAIIR